MTEEKQTNQAEAELEQEVETTECECECEECEVLENPLQKELDEVKDKLLRTLAEYDNFRKRSQKEKEAIYPDAVCKTVEKFLPVIDTFERALATETSDAEFKKGVEMIYTMMQTTLTSLGVEEIKAEGEVFNPDLHNAVMHTEDDSVGENVITAVLQKGYKLGDKVVRYAMVSVAN